MTLATSPNQRSPFDAGYCGEQTRINRQAGLTLVELLVALVLGLVLILGVLNIFVSNRETFRVTENLARIQENARAGFDFMARDVREAGQNPCGTTLVANVIRKTGAIPWWADWNSGPIIGVDGSVDRTDIVAFGTTTNARVAGTDAVLVIRAEQDEKAVINHQAGTFEMTLKAVTGLVADDVVLACDMQGAAIFQLGTVSAGLSLINYDPGFAALNCSDKLGHPTPINCAAPPVKVFPAGAVLSKLSASFWYIGYSASGKRSLYRTRIIKKTVAGVPTITTEPEEMVTGVQDLQMTYLTKNVSTEALAADWVAASDAVFDPGVGAWSEVNVSQAVAARIVMTLQSEENVGTNNLPIQRQLIHVVGLRSRDTLFDSTP